MAITKKDHGGKLREAGGGGGSLGDSGRASPPPKELERMRHMKMAQQHLDLAYQMEEGSPSRSSSPEANAAAQAAADQNRLNFAHEKLGESSDKGTNNVTDLTQWFPNVFGPGTPREGRILSRYPPHLRIFTALHLQ